MKNSILFFFSWLRAPRSIGSVIPSSSQLAKAMVDQVDMNAPGIILELGAGTGSLTKRLLKSGLTQERLFVIESNIRFCKILRKKFPNITVIHKDAMQIDKIMKNYPIQSISTVISSLPLLSLEKNKRDRIISNVFKLMGKQSKLVQYTYGLKSPIPSYLLKQFHIKAKVVKRIWRNIPPAAVWTYQSNGL